MTRKYSSISVETTLATGISNSATTMTVAAGTGSALMGGVTLAAGNVDQFTVALDVDTNNEEIVFITAVSSDTFTIVRGQAGTSAISHTGGASVNDNVVFGYQARYQEYRTRNSVAVGEMRDTLKQWNLGRSFASNPGLTDDFISVTDAQRTQWMTRAYAVTTEAPFILTFGNRLIMSRPMPGLPEPGLMDHF